MRAHPPLLARGRTAVARRWCATQPLGQTGLRVSRLAAGCGPLGSPVCDDAGAVATVHRWLAHGCNYIDTSPSYGQSERRVGLALETVPRQSYVLQTKCGDEGPQNGGHSPFSKRGVLASCRNSLAQLGVDRLDALLLHDPYVDELRQFLGPGGGIEAIRELKAEGTVGAFGLGAREHEAHTRLVEAVGDEFEIAVCVDDHNLMRRYMSHGGLARALQANRTSIVNAAVLYRGLLTDKPSIYSDARFGAAHPKLIELAQGMAEFARAQGRSLFDFAVSDAVRSDGMTASIFGWSPRLDLANN